MAPPLYSPYSVTLPSCLALFGIPAVVTITTPVAWARPWTGFHWSISYNGTYSPARPD